MRLGNCINWDGGSKRFFLHFDHLPKDSNSIASMLYEEIRAIKTGDTPAASATELILQSDGGSENA